MSITRVQETRNAPGAAGVTSRAVTVASTGLGNLLLVVVITGSTSVTHNAPTDNASGSTAYTQVGTTLSLGGQNLSLWRKLSSQSGATTVTATVSADPTGFFDVYVAEYNSAGATWTQNATNQGTGNSATASSGNFARATGDLLFASGLTAATTATNLANLVDTTDGNGIGDTLGAANGTTAAATFTTTSGNWDCIGASFTPTAGGLLKDISFTPGNSNPSFSGGNMVSY